jgi:Ca2+-binding EF-hand superfamily protein
VFALNYLDRHTRSASTKSHHLIANQYKFKVGERFMTGSIQGTSTSATSNITAINQQIQDFKDGKTKITKEDLSNIMKSGIQQGQAPSAALMNIYDSYDQIDKNNDGGIDYNELQTYQNTPKGILSSMGISADSINQQINQLSLEYLGGNGSSTVFQQPSILDTGLFNDTSSESSDSFSGYVDDFSSSISQLMQNYNSTSTGSNADLSIIDELA